jgi:trans-aconitate methyltransferase
MTDGYLFGDSDLAAHRLELLARAFESSSREFLRSVATSKCRLAIDLGCGPGFTTRLLADTIHARETIGLDSSEHFLDLARRVSHPNVSYLRHDVTSVPFPIGHADLIYARYLLTHLKQPHLLVEQFGTQLAAGGLLLIEENQTIESGNLVLRRYLDVLGWLMEQRGNNLYIGAMLDSMPDSALLRRHSSRATRVQVSNRDAAAMFRLNLQTWAQDALLLTRFKASDMHNLGNALGELAAGIGITSEIEWTLRQIVFERRGAEDDIEEGQKVGLGLASPVLGAQAAGADVDAAGLAAHVDSGALDVGIPGALGVALGVADVEPRGGAFVTKLACGHSANVSLTGVGSLNRIPRKPDPGKNNSYGRPHTPATGRPRWGRPARHVQRCGRSPGCAG